MAIPLRPFAVTAVANRRARSGADDVIAQVHKRRQQHADTDFVRTEARRNRAHLSMKALVTLLILMPGLGLAQVRDSATARPLRLIGVYDAQSGRPLEGVEVRDLGVGGYATTSLTGTASLGFVVFRDSSARVGLRKLGYRPKELVLREGATEALTELLDPVVTLPTVRTTATFRLDTDPGDRAGFDRRCAQGNRNVVTCFRRSYFLEHSSYSIAELLKTAPGVRTICSGSGTNAASAGAGNPSLPTCRIANGCEWYIDGFRFDPYPTQRYLTYAAVQQQLTAAQIVGVEVYFNNGPLKFYNPLVGCAFVIWTAP